MRKLELALTSLVVLLAVAGVAHAAATISQKGKMFQPDAIEVSVNEKVLLLNDDDVAHNVLVTAPGGATRNHGLQKPGEAAEIQLDKAGTFTVRCGIHPRMKLAITVK